MVSAIFKERPTRWDLRGSPFLWDVMEEYFDAIRLPISASRFESMFRGKFAECVGVELGVQEETYVEGFAHGGMSAGWVSHRWWVGEALPLLVLRLEAANGQVDAAES